MSWFSSPQPFWLGLEWLGAGAFLSFPNYWRKWSTQDLLDIWKEKVWCRRTSLRTARIIASKQLCWGLSTTWYQQLIPRSSRCYACWTYRQRSTLSIMSSCCSDWYQWQGTSVAACISRGSHTMRQVWRKVFYTSDSPLWCAARLSAWAVAICTLHSATGWCR